MAQRRLKVSGLTWPFAIAKDIAWVRQWPGGEVKPGPAVTINCGAYLSNTCAVFTAPEVVVVAIDGGPGSSNATFVTIEPGYEGYMYRVAYWYHEGDDWPRVVRAWLSDNPGLEPALFGLADLHGWITNVQDRKDAEFLISQWPRLVGHFSPVALVFAIVSAFLLYEVMRFLDGKTWAALVKGSSYLPLVLFGAFLVYGYVQGVRGGVDREHPLNEWKWGAPILGVMVGLVGLFHYVINAHFDKTSTEVWSALQERWQAEDAKAALNIYGR